MMKLFFPLRLALELAEHAAAAPRHDPSFTQLEKGLPGKPSLVWVKEDGTYLMSNGRPRLYPAPDYQEGPQVIVEAEGWGTGTRHDLGGIEEIGGDDFSEFIDLADPLGDFPTLLEAMRAAVRANVDWLVIVVHDLDSYTVGLDRRGAQ